MFRIDNMRSYYWPKLSTAAADYKGDGASKGSNSKTGIGDDTDAETTATAGLVGSNGLLIYPLLEAFEYLGLDLPPSLMERRPSRAAAGTGIDKAQCHLRDLKEGEVVTGEEREYLLTGRLESRAYTMDQHPAIGEDPPQERGVTAYKVQWPSARKLIGYASDEEHLVSMSLSTELASLKDGFDRFASCGNLALAADKSATGPEQGSMCDKLGLRRDSLTGKYEFRLKFARGGYGEVWKAKGRRKAKPGFEGEWDGEYGNNAADFVLKRMLIEKGENVYLSGLREIYFGSLFRGGKSNSNIARFVEYFEHEDCLEPGKKALWLVFYNEGSSLEKYLYTPIEHEGFVKMERSSMWKDLKSTAQGWSFFRVIVYEVLLALSSIHEKNVTHRDVKSSNILMRFNYITDEVEIKLSDFGSAVDNNNPHRLYANEGPTKDELSMDYAPPEVIFGDLPYSLAHPTSYDMWSVGILMLEMVLGTSDVFSGVLDARSRAHIDLKYARTRGSDGSTSKEDEDKAKKRLYVYYAMQKYCIHPSPSVENVHAGRGKFTQQVLFPGCDHKTLGE
eukprot:Nk52_evm43s1705 gene=Nk52_evmTU43s1705